MAVMTMEENVPWLWKNAIISQFLSYLIFCMRDHSIQTRYFRADFNNLRISNHIIWHLRHTIFVMYFPKHVSLWKVHSLKSHMHWKASKLLWRDTPVPIIGPTHRKLSIVTGSPHIQLRHATLKPTWYHQTDEKHQTPKKEIAVETIKQKTEVASLILCTKINWHASKKYRLASANLKNQLWTAAHPDENQILTAMKFST